MKNQQHGLYGCEQVDAEHVTSVDKKLNDLSIKKRFAESVKKFIAKHKISAIIAAGIFIWGGPGELVLPEPYRFSHFIGTRLANTNVAQVKTSLPMDAERAEVMTATGNIVQSITACENLRTQLAQQAFSQCIATNGTKPLCEFRKNEALGQPCDIFNPATLVKDYDSKRKQGGAE